MDSGYVRRSRIVRPRSLHIYMAGYKSKSWLGLFLYSFSVYVQRGQGDEKYVQHTN